MSRLAGESGCDVLGFLCLSDDQPVVEEQIEKIPKTGNQGCDATSAVNTKGESMLKDRSLIMKPHPKENPKIDHWLSSLWALALTFCRIWMSRLDKPAGMSLWRNPYSADDECSHKKFLRTIRVFSSPSLSI